MQVLMEMVKLPEASEDVIKERSIFKRVSFMDSDNEGDIRPSSKNSLGLFHDAV